MLQATVRLNSSKTGTVVVEQTNMIHIVVKMLWYLLQVHMVPLDVSVLVCAVTE